ncbi:trace amine-associated receptor 13c-like [Megalobrama amblycephala]|uniref:trace amine-associated receptor 13c-like n=1 Tax=Megalobrama amblycephala TaxID=75352 RepID=UPI002013C9EE|nr:trace amine-associated receptor 13c-like [Megalobrama amblycephala]
MKREQNKLLTGGASLMAYETEDHETQYCFPAINSSCIKAKRSRYEYNIMYVFVSLLSAWTVFVNLLVIISISHFKKLHTPTNLIILSLALADVLMGLVMPIEGTRLIETCWYFGDTFCRLFVVILELLFSASLSNLVLIAIDRYLAVCHPLLYPQKITTTKTAITIFLSWVCSSAYYFIIAINNGPLETSHRTDRCYGECYFTMGFAWIVTDLFIGFIFPCTLIITLYLRIFYVVHQQVKVINSLKGGKRVMEGSVRRKSESKAALTLGIIVTVYLLCFIPYYICSISVTSSTIINILAWVLYANSGMNPLVYALFYPWFKKTVKHILTQKIFQPASSLVNIFTEH